MDSILKTICTVESKHAAHFIWFCNVFFSFSYLKCIEKIPVSISELTGVRSLYSKLYILCIPGSFLVLFHSLEAAKWTFEISLDSIPMT